MKAGKWDVWIIVGYFSGCVVVILLSWLCNMYGAAVRNILSAEGIRHAIKYTMQDFSGASPAPLLYVAAVYGVVMKSGIFNLLRHTRHLTLKQRSATGVTVFAGILYLLLFASGIFMPHAPLLGVTGHIERSVLSDGWLYVVSTFFLLLGCVYGIASGVFYKLEDFIEGLCAGISLYAPCFIALFAGSQLWSCLVYAGFLSHQADSTWLVCVKDFVCYLPFLLKGVMEVSYHENKFF